MKRFLNVAVFVFAAMSLSAASLWTGNAAVSYRLSSNGTLKYQAASNTFPPGTELVVSNPRGGGSVEVMVSGPVDVPGVFILLEEEAASVIGVPDDHVVPVRVSLLSDVVDKGSRPSESAALVMMSNDPDYNLALSLKEPHVPVEEPPMEEAPIEEDPIEEAPIEEVPYDIESLPQELIYFLMPSGPRPPEPGPEEFSFEEPVIPDTPPPVVSPPAPPAPPAPLADGHYIQIGAYSSHSILEESRNQLVSEKIDYPVHVVEEAGGILPVHKLLLGPFLPDEVGGVLESVRSHSFPDAFRYIQ